jgi:uncharacterized membrane protein YraQ (UPF0718 family)
VLGCSAGAKQVEESMNIEWLTRALWMSFTMFWDIFWGLSLGFILSAAIDVAVSKQEMAKLLPDTRPRSLATAMLLGAASSSCSYAAVAMTRSAIRKGANFVAAMAFQFAATNLVLELGVLMWALMAWQFAAAEFIGAPIMILVLLFLFKSFVSKHAILEATRNAEKSGAGAMEGHAEMATMQKEGTWKDRLASRAGWIQISHYYVMNWQMLWRDIGVGVLVAGALGAWVPASVWQTVFMTHDPVAGRIWGAFVGPLIALASFTCSVGNVPLAAVLWNGGISFGGVAGFIYGDLIIPPILNIYRKYYGAKMSFKMGILFYVAMVCAAVVVEALFGLTGLIPTTHRVSIMTGQAISFNYTAVLDIIFGAAGVLFYTLYLRTGGPAMMRKMG